MTMKTVRFFSFFYNAFKRIVLIGILTQASFLQSNEEISKFKLEQNFSCTDREILESFFRLMMTESEAGYVLFGEKPICFHAYPKHDIDIWGTTRHIENTILREGARVWKKYQSTVAPNSNYLLVVGETYWNSKDKYLPVLFINKSALFKSVNDNLSLFQYILGPSINPEKILSRILDPKENLFSILKNNKVLIGIVLGFGAQNALFGSRLENLKESVLIPVKVPFNQTEEISALTKEQLLLLDYTPGPNEYFAHHSSQPSSGYTSIKEESDDLEKLIDVSSPILTTRKPRFFYGGLKNNAENLQLIKRLEGEQNKIIEVLNSDSFMDQIFSKLKVTLGESLSTSLNLTQENLTDIIAHHIWKRLEDNDLNEPDKVNLLINGIYSAKKNNLTSDELEDVYLDAFVSFITNKKIFELKKKYQKIEKFFQGVSENSKNQCIIPSKLYYCIIKPGNKKTLTLNDHRILVHYHIKTLDEQEICNTYNSGIPEWIDLTETVPGFNTGISGMKINEIRRIYIHPDLGYGAHTCRFEKGACLIATVQLLDIESNNLESFHKNAIVQAADKIPLISDEEFLKSQNLFAYNEGVMLGNHYKQIESILNLETVAEKLRSFASKELKVSSLRSEQEQILNHLNWLIYSCIRADKEG